MRGKVFVAGHRGLVGSAIVRKLRQDGEENLVLRTSKELDLRDGAQVYAQVKSVSLSERVA